MYGYMHSLYNRSHPLSSLIHNDQQLQVTLERIRHFQRQVIHLRQVETNPSNCPLSASGYLAEPDRMQR
jgi:hypothetical protein